MSTTAPIAEQITALTEPARTVTVRIPVALPRKSTVAAAVATALTAAGVKAAVLDCDIQGPSMPTLLNLPPAQAAGGRIGPHELPDDTRASASARCSPATSIARSPNPLWRRSCGFMGGGLDLGDNQVLVVDLSPGTPIVQHLINRMRNPRTLVVTMGSKVAHNDLRRAHGVAQRSIGVVENLTRASAQTANGETVEVRLYDGADTGEIAAELELPYLGSLPQETSIGALARPARR